jgi:hypothetical protein
VLCVKDRLAIDRIVKAITPLAKSDLESPIHYQVTITVRMTRISLLLPLFSFLLANAVAQSPAPQEEFEKSIPGQSLVPATSETELDRRPMYAAV